MRFYQQLKNIYHLIQAIGSNVWFGFPSKRIRVVGVTGTNGKTTTVQIVGKILEEAGHKIAINSTINYKIGDREWVNKTKFTTVSSWELQKFIKQAVKAGCEYLILETSSHALDQYRVWGVDYDVAVVTNITREHLDYHRMMENYKDVKLKLFRKISGNSKFKITNSKQIPNSKSQIKNKKVAIVNLDMKWAREFLELEVGKKYGYCCKLKCQSSNVKTSSENFQSKVGQPSTEKIERVEARDIKLEDNKSEFMIHDSKFLIHLPGQFNIENALAAVCVGLSQNIDLKKCSQALGGVKKIPGRMDYVENEKGLNIIIDYALTPDSMEKLGKLIKKIKSQDKKLIWVFGACGQRDRGKRPIMGKIVSKYADIAIITNEDPYHEDPNRIVEEIIKGIKDSNKYLKIMDRKKAIKEAIKMAKEGDYILVTGKGAEETMAVGDKITKWNDRKIIKEILKLNHKSKIPNFK